jgi:hypothetical protein
VKLIAPQSGENASNFDEVMRLASITAIANRKPRVVGMLTKPGEKPWFGHLAMNHSLTRSMYWTSAWVVLSSGRVVPWEAKEHGAAVN